MGINTEEMNLDLSSVYIPKTISEFLSEISEIADTSEKSSKLNGYVQTLEDELSKIHAFKRELPLCTLLLNDAIEKLKEETLQPLEGNFDKNGGGKILSDFTDKKNWMSSVQLWSTNNSNSENNHREVNKNVSLLSSKSRDKVEDGCETKYPFQRCNLKNRRGAFVPFKGSSGMVMKEEKVALSLQGLSILKPVAEMGSIDLNLEGNSSGSGSSSVIDQMKPRTESNQQKQKKQRRCWSPELHQRFVYALQQLGGAQSNSSQNSI